MFHIMKLTLTAWAEKAKWSQFSDSGKIRKRLKQQLRWSRWLSTARMPLPKREEEANVWTWEEGKERAGWAAGPGGENLYFFQNWVKQIIDSTQLREHDAVPDPSLSLKLTCSRRNALWEPHFTIISHVANRTPERKGRTIHELLLP